MFRDTLKKNNMDFETEDCAIRLSCDSQKMFNELHEAIDRVLMKYYATPLLTSAPMDEKTFKELEEAIDKMNGENK